jgi:hypothetical protein
MAYIGRAPSFGAFQTQTITPTGVTTTYNLSYPVASPSSILVSVNGVLQQPVAAYGLQAGGTQIVFTEIIETGSSLFIIYLGEKYTVATLGNNIVVDAMIVPYTITSSRLANTGITAGTYGAASNTKSSITVDTAGRITSVATIGIDNIPQSNVTNLTSTLATKATTGKAIAMSLVFGG